MHARHGKDADRVCADCLVAEMHKAGVMSHVAVGQKDARQHMTAVRRLDMQFI